MRPTDQKLTPPLIQQRAAGASALALGAGRTRPGEAASFHRGWRTAANWHTPAASSTPSRSTQRIKKWHDETPDDFVFSLKASRYATNRRVLAEAGDSITRFIDSGISELGRKLGPIVWQFMPGKNFEPEDFEAFLALLPNSVDGKALRHAVDVRHESFMTPDYLALACRYRVATVFSDAAQFPSFADLSGDFVYARLMQSHADLETGYAEAALKAWAERARRWSEGGAPDDLPSLEEPSRHAAPREVFIYFINGAKERAPAAAVALLNRLGVGATGGGTQKEF